MDNCDISVIIEIAKRGGGDALPEDVERLTDLCEKYGLAALDAVENQLKKPSISVAEAIDTVLQCYNLALSVL